MLEENTFQYATPKSPISKKSQELANLTDSSTQPQVGDVFEKFAISSRFSEKTTSTSGRSDTLIYIENRVFLSESKE